MLYVCLHLPIVCFRVAAFLANKDDYMIKLLLNLSST